MTRGKLILITDTDGKCFVSGEFNGDMGISMSCGEEAFLKLNQCKTIEEYIEIVREFIKEFNYDEDYDNLDNDDELVGHSNVIERTFEKATYFEHWFSDYLYILNLSGKDITTKDYNGKEIVLENEKVSVLDFGQLLSDKEIREAMED